MAAIKAERNLPEGEDLPEATKKHISNYMSDLQYHTVRDMILNDRIRLDGRTANDWNQIRSDLRTVANIYNLRFNDDRGYNVYSGNDRRGNRRWE